MRSPIVLLLLISSAGQASAQTWTLASPDTKTTIAVTRQADGSLVWRVGRDGMPILADSPLGIRRTDQSFESRPHLRSGCQMSEASTNPTRCRSASGTTITSARREQALSFANAAGARMDVILRAHDDGTALRYRFPETDATRRTVVAEATGLPSADPVDRLADAPAGGRPVRPRLRGFLSGGQRRHTGAHRRWLGVSGTIQDYRQQVAPDHRSCAGRWLRWRASGLTRRPTACIA